MKLTVRPADLVSDRHAIIDLIRRYLNPSVDDARFKWLYLDNPFGQAKAWLAVDAATDIAIGVAAAFPRLLSFPEHEELGWVFGDFCVVENCRSLGPALQLQRACIEGTLASAGATYYDFPSSSMLAVLKRLKVEASGKMVRLVLPLKVDRFVQRAIPFPGVAQVVSGLGNQFLKVRHHRMRTDTGVQVDCHQGTFGGEFSQLQKKFSQQYGICVKRSQEYLNWKYRADPQGGKEVISARRNGNLLAYAVFGEAGNDVALLDVFGDKAGHVIESLIGEIVRLASQRRKSAVSIQMASTHPWLKLFQNIGFITREAAPLVIASMPTQPLKGIPGQFTWSFMQTDRDC